MTASVSPLFERHGPEPFAITAAGPVSAERFVAEAVALALPDAPYLINVCQGRYRFLLGLFASAAAGRTSLLPASRNAPAGRTLASRYAGASVLDDAVVGAAQEALGPVVAPAAMPGIGDTVLAAVVFTSGSTGEPQPNLKRWGALRAASRLHAERLGLERATVVTTVPPGHMYGLEWTVLIATVLPLTLYCPGVFYPDDVRRALDAAPGPRMLVTTPVHLRALLRSAVRYPPVDVVVSATAPLEQALAAEAERRLQCRVLEIYGCSEAGTVAHRMPARESGWRLFPGFELAMRGERAYLSAGHLESPVALADRVALCGDGTFVLRGRWGDLVKVAGKRASLEDLNARLLALPEVEDGVIFDPTEDGSGRLCALVVAPGRNAEQLRRRLADAMDPAFLPRPLRLVPALPRSATGKLARADLLRLLDHPAAGP